MQTDIVSINSLQQKRKVISVLIVILVILAGIITIYNHSIVTQSKNNAYSKLPPVIRTSSILAEKVIRATKPEEISIRETPDYKILYNQNLNSFSVLIFDSSDKDASTQSVADFFRVLNIEISDLQIEYYMQYNPAAQ